MVHFLIIRDWLTPVLCGHIGVIALSGPAVQKTHVNAVGDAGGTGGIGALIHYRVMAPPENLVLKDLHPSPPPTWLCWTRPCHPKVL